MSASSAAGWRRLIGVLSLPRSGSTVLTAVLGAHSQVREIYEPWNDRSAALSLEVPTSFDDFIDRFAHDPGGRTTLVVKETTSRPLLVDRLCDLLDDAPPAVGTGLLILLRNPFHTFLSMCEARREYWGSPALSPDLATFDAWARPALGALARLAAVADARGAFFVSYDHLVRSTATIPTLMAAVGLESEPGQATFGDRIDRSRVRGDPKMLNDAGMVSEAAADARAAEFAELRPMLLGSPHFGRIRRIRQQIAAMPAVVRASEAAQLLAALAGPVPVRGASQSASKQKRGRTPR